MPSDPSFPSFDLTGRVALVTGAARGLGEAIALALAHAGADVVLGLRDAARTPAVAGEIERLGRRAFPVQMESRNATRSERRGVRRRGRSGASTSSSTTRDSGPRIPPRT